MKPMGLIARFSLVAAILAAIFAINAKELGLPASSGLIVFFSLILVYMAGIAKVWLHRRQHPSL